MEVNQGLSMPLAKAIESVTGKPGRRAGRPPNWEDPEDVSLALSLMIQLRTVDIGDDCGPLKYAEHIFGKGLTSRLDARVFIGTELAVTDWAASNIVIVADRQAFVQVWRQPAVAAGWVGAACFVRELIATGKRDPGHAEVAVSGVGPFDAMCSEHPEKLDTFVRACKGLADGARATRSRLREKPPPRERAIEHAADVWHRHRESRQRYVAGRAVVS